MWRGLANRVSPVQPGSYEEALSEIYIFSLRLLYFYRHQLFVLSCAWLAMDCELSLGHMALRSSELKSVTLSIYQNELFIYYLCYAVE